LTVGTDTAPRSPAARFAPGLAELGIVHRRDGYGDPDSRAFVESSFSTLKQRCIWRDDFEPLDEARHRIGA
jgi:putative transposase